MIKLRAIIPTKIILDPEAMARAIENTLDGVAKDIKVDFDVTTQTWKDRPAFSTEKREGYRSVSTEDEIYGYVNFGTRPHVIMPVRARALRFQTGFRPKTRVRFIGSNVGGTSGPFVGARQVQHPGSEGRAFDETIQSKWDALMQNTFQRAIDSEISRASR